MTSDQLNELKDRLVLIRGYLDVDKRLSEIEEKEQLSLDPDLWNDPKKAEVLLKELKSHKNWVEKYNKIKEIVDDAEVLLEFQKMGEATEDEVNKRYSEAVEIIEDIEFRSTLNREEDELSCILEINAGAGGTEACDWAEML